MKEKLNLVLLIDDNRADNYFHQMVIEDAGCALETIAIESGQKALDYLTTKLESGYPGPDLILLDINMPRMNGWEFLEKYEQLDEKYKARVVVVMLTTSTDPLNQRKASSLQGVKGVKHKPLTEKMLLEIIATYFPEKF